MVAMTYERRYREASYLAKQQFDFVLTVTHSGLGIHS